MEKKLQVVMLPTKEKAQLWLTPANKLTTSTMEQQPIHGKRELGWVGQHLYFLSDEEIKEEGEWYLYWSMNETFEQGKVSQSKQNAFIPRCPYKKIIATTDSSLTIPALGSELTGWTNYLPQPSQSFLELYIKEYNKGNQIKEVLVEYEKDEESMGKLNWLNKVELLYRDMKTAKEFNKSFTLEEWIEQNL